METLVETRHLRVFVTLARTGNMKLAARELNLTPSAISHALKAFEESLGKVLFERTTRRMLLTDEGTRLLAQAQEILQSLQQMQTGSTGADRRAARLRIGASPTACQYLIPAVIRELKESCPQMSIQITQGSAASIAQDLAEGRIDLGLCPRTPDHRNLTCIPVASDVLSFITHPQHPWARAQKVNRAEIAAQRFILTESRSHTKRLIDDYWSREKIVIQPFIEIGNEEVIKELVRLDMGVGIIPAWLAAEELDKGLLTSLPLGRKPPVREWVVCHRNNYPCNFGETLFVGISRLIAGNRIGWSGVIK
ncbi:LysR family transcriptional regulator [Brevifollis gellanilyticus]|uniref:LysR family transcriptional regulator n=1 Tax=Brevifollis gellanilyticus TaxID=748831 RepID=A0A512MA68_9BACT|nr:LysR family transcriptional regulator [Brevifollis gellanilyticus]GEP43231.1 LysR family transcriptional regulator [Brevifollis gellanilyticus]